jgi:IS30 family transposase
VRISDLRRAGEGGQAIAAELGRSPATVSRELRRNVAPSSSVYRPHAAQRMAEQRRARPKTGELVADIELREFVQDKLKRRWSPEQIAQALRSEFPDQSHRHLVPETIYQAVYRRRSRYTILLYLPGRHTAEAVRDAVIEAMAALPKHLRRSLTWDQGSEIAMHAEIAHTLDMPVYFGEKASPWQRPSNELFGDGGDFVGVVAAQQRVRLPKGHWHGERAARDILAPSGKGRAFRSLGCGLRGGARVHPDADATPHTRAVLRRACH